MGNAIAYLSGNTLTYQPGMFKRGTVGQNFASTLTGGYTWWNSVVVNPSQFLIYCDTFTTSATTESNVTPSAWSTPDLTDASLLNVINSVPELVGQPKFNQWIVFSPDQSVSVIKKIFMSAFNWGRELQQRYLNYYY